MDRGERPWHTLAAEEACRTLASDPQKGLTEPEARKRLSIQGPNDITEHSRRTVLQIVASQFSDFMILVLIGAAVISGLLAETLDALAILVIVALNGAMGATQEIRAQHTIEALRRMAARSARVLRDGRVLAIPARDVVPGDIALIEAGDIVPADMRVLTASSLSIDESALTGESLAVEKTAAGLFPAHVPLGDRRNMLYKDTQVTRGRGMGVVVATGDDTEMGRIADLLESTETSTPLQRRIAHFGRQIALVILLICGALFVTGLAQGQPALLMFLTAVSLAVAAVPEALPAVVTISLAIGARKLAALNALVRHLPAVEALGSVTYICADKTGTLTENRMRLGVIWAAGERMETIGDGRLGHALLRELVGLTLALNNDVTTDGEAPNGDPTEVALFEAAAAMGFDPAALRKKMPRVAELTFDEQRKCMTTLHGWRHGTIALVKGAPEVVLARCREALGKAGSEALDAQSIAEEAHRLAADGYRVLALAYRDFDVLPGEIKPATIETGLTFLALVGLVDPPRAEARRAVNECLTAGIVPVMITGDHPATARHIAQRLGIAQDDSATLTGQELAQLSDEELARRVRDVRVYARVSPEQKIRIVAALENVGEYAAMTGDGVNDAPALKRAAIGVAMGKRGTDVAREAADMLLLDDNFATIVVAVAEGRRIFDDIKKFVRYTMTSNAGEIWTLFAAPLLGLPLPLLPIQILWINLLTDGLPGLAFSAEPAERGIMRRPPRPPDESVLDRQGWISVLWVGLLIGALSIGAQWYEYGRGAAYWQTVTFTVLVVAQLFNALALRSPRESLFSQGITTNPLLLGAIALTVAAQLAVIYVPALNAIFKTEPLPAFDLALCFALGGLVLVAVELQKLLSRRSTRRGNAPEHA